MSLKEVTHQQQEMMSLKRLITKGVKVKLSEKLEVQILRERERK